MMHDPNIEAQEASISEFPVATEASGAVTAWEKVRQHLLAFMRLEPDWDGEGAPSICPDLIRSALHLANQLMRDGWVPPHDAYPLPDGNIILEWQYPDGVIERIEVVGEGRGELMVTYPNAPAEFSEVRWSAAAPSWGGAAGGERPLLQGDLERKTAILEEKDEFIDPSECASFLLAA